MNLVRGILLKAIYPALMIVGLVFKGSREPLQSFVIRINNWLVERAHIRTDRVLVLLPHCLQTDQCDIRLTHDVRKCKRCGRCNIAGLLEVVEGSGLELFVASGGTLARRIVAEYRPGAIVAVACERDLSSGIADVYPLPVFGVWNERPEGPCLNTRVSIESVKQAIRLFVPPAA